MLRIRRITGSRDAAERAVVAEVQAIMAAQFAGLPPDDIAKLPDQLNNPMKYGFVSELLVSETAHHKVRGFALVLHDPDLHFSYLELMSTAPGRTGGGQGAALYNRVRDAARDRGSMAVYFECLPDDPALSPDPSVRRQNQARLKFYEQFGARPLMGTAYETPTDPAVTDSPYLAIDTLGREGLPAVKDLQAAVRAILERKYAAICPPGYIDKVVASIQEGRVSHRAPRYEGPNGEAGSGLAAHGKIALVINDKHDIHHVRERGYVEAPVRIRSIMREFDKGELFTTVERRHFGDRHVTAVHDSGLVAYIERACAEAPEGKSVYPYVFPVRNAERKPKERSVLAGYWCIDTFTPLNRNAYPAARRAVDCALTAADCVLEGARFAYALVRPPGHHAERRTFGGFCYFNNAAIAAHYLSGRGRVAVLDIDYHHGNGTQDIFYERADVLTVSVHGHPSFAYPYFTGFPGEKGRGPGAGYNLNIALPEAVTPDEHRAAVGRALDRIARHAPDWLVLAIGFDTAVADPTGTWSNRAADFRALGQLIGAAGYPTVIVQEGGYRVRTLGANARNFFQGLAESEPGPRRTGRAGRPARAEPQAATLAWRDAVSPADLAAVRRLVATTEMFTPAEVDIAVELVLERIARGQASGYEFVLAEADGQLAGYACYGATPGTAGTWDLYWIVVGPQGQRRGIGGALLAEVEARIGAAPGRSLVAETSSLDLYRPTRGFYRKHGFEKAAELADFYRPGDGKIIYRKWLSHDAPPARRKT